MQNTLKIFHEFTRKNQVSYLNPTDLFKFKWKIGDWVLLSSEEEKVLVQIFPAEKVPSGYIQISENDRNDLTTMDRLEYVTLSIPNTPILTAARISFKKDEQVEKNELDLFVLTVQQTLIELSHVIRGKIFSVEFKTRTIKCTVTDISTLNGKVDGDYIYKVSTKVVVLIDEESKSVGLSQVLYSDIGGLSDQLKELTKIVDLGLNQSSMFKDLGLKPIKGVLLYGPPGVFLHF